jgi:uncharacterized membrane protein
MESDLPRVAPDLKRTFVEWLSVILIATLAMNTVIYFVYASPYFGLDANAITAHSNHRPWFFVHILGGGIALFVGPWMFWSGLKERHLGLHRIIGKVYLIAGSIGVTGGMVISAMGVHEPKSFGISLFTLGIVWLVCGAMAYRSIRNWQIEQHKEWMIRSFALSITFVTCRFVGKIPLFGHLGPEAVTAVIWMNWVLTLFFAEVAIQWRKTRVIN